MESVDPKERSLAALREASALLERQTKTLRLLLQAAGEVDALVDLVVERDTVGDFEALSGLAARLHESYRSPPTEFGDIERGVALVRGAASAVLRHASSAG